MSIRMSWVSVAACGAVFAAAGLTLIGCESGGDGTSPDGTLPDNLSADSALGIDAAPSGDAGTRVDGAVLPPRDARANDSASAPEASGGQGEPPELAGITLAHNTARIAENANLPQLTWDPALAAIAAAWGAKCQDTDAPMGLIDHNPGRSNGYPSYVGENIYGGPNPSEAVRLWMDEKPNYNFATGQCSGVCGHYTQVVWKATTKLGCAVSRCPNLRYSDSVICNYGPGGNFGGQKPY
jgi:pathogenesis-related protein 1